MKKALERCNALRADRRKGDWSAEKEIELRKLEARIQSANFSRIRVSERRMAEKRENTFEKMIRRELPKLPNLLRRRDELLYERSAGINWTVEKHYVLEALVERIQRLERYEARRAIGVRS